MGVLTFHAAQPALSIHPLLHYVLSGRKGQFRDRGAGLLLQCLGDDLNALPDDLTELFKIPYDDYEVRVHSNSWGTDMTNEQLEYDQRAIEIDEFGHTHPAMVIICKLD
jgi:hypothetical protein